jgi:hypothetical protein
MPEKITITFLAPSYLLYAVPSGQSVATAVFTTSSTHPPMVTEVPLSRNAFVKVGGGKIGGPTLTQIKIKNGSLIRPFSPASGSSITVGPDAYAILQPVENSDVYELSIFFGGKDQIVKFEKDDS